MGTPGLGQGVSDFSSAVGCWRSLCTDTAETWLCAPQKAPDQSHRFFLCLPHRWNREDQKAEPKCAAEHSVAWPRHPARSSAWARPEVAQPIQVRSWGHKLGATAMQPSPCRCLCPPRARTAPRIQQVPLFPSLPIRAGADKDVGSPLCGTRCGQAQLFSLLEATPGLQKLLQGAK